MRIKLFAALFVIVSAIVVTSFFVVATTTGQKERKQEDDATVVQRGLVSPEEHEYSREYAKLYSFREGRKFGEVIEENEREGKDPDFSGYLGEREAFFLPDAAERSSADFFSSLSCSSDAIVIGASVNKSSHMTEDEKFIYSEYEFSVDRVVKNNAASPISPGAKIDVTRPGGSIKLDGHRIRIQDRSFELLQQSKKYLLFLRFVPSANGYMPAGPQGDFAVENKSVRKLSTGAVPRDVKSIEDSEKLEKTVRAAVLVPCSSDQGEVK